MAFGGGSIGSAYGQIIIETNKAVSNINGLRGSLNNFAQQTQTVGFGLQSMATGLLAVGGSMAAGLVGATKVFVGFDTAMQNVASISPYVAQGMQDVRDSVMAIAGDTARAPQELAEALYEIYSAGIKGADGLVILEQAAKAANAGLATTEQTAQVLTAVINSGIKGSKDGVLAANEINDILFKTVEQGVFTYPELTQQIGDNLTMAAALGVSLEELGAAYATLTQAGVPLAESTTQVNAIMSALLKPSTEFSAILSDHNFSNGVDLLTKGFGGETGLAGVLLFLDEVLADNNENLPEFSANIRAMRGALALLFEDGDAYTEMLAEMENSAGATDRALAQQQKAVGYSFRALATAIQTAAIMLIDPLAPAIKAVADLLTELVKLFNKLPAPVKEFIAIALAASTAMILLAGGIALVLARLYSMRVGLAAMGLSFGRILAPIRNVALAITLLSTLFAADVFGIRTKLFQGLQDFKDGFNQYWNQMNLDENPIARFIKAIGYAIDTAAPEDSWLDDLSDTLREIGDYVDEAIDKINYLRQLLGILDPFGTKLDEEGVKEFNKELGASGRMLVKFFGSKNALALMEEMQDLREPLRNLQVDLQVGGRAAKDFWKLMTGQKVDLNKFQKRLQHVFGVDLGTKMTASFFRLRLAMREFGIAVGDAISSLFGLFGIDLEGKFDTWAHTIHTVGDAIEWLIKKFRFSFLPAMGEVLLFISDNLILALKTLTALLRGDLAEAWDNFSELLSNMGNLALDIASIAVTIGGWLITQAVTLLSAITTQVIDLIGAIPFELVFVTIGQWAVTGAKNLWEMIRNFAFGLVYGGDPNRGDETGGPIGAGNPVTFSTFMASVGEWIVGGAKNLWEKIVQFAAGLMGLPGAGGSFYNPYNITGGLAGGTASRVPLGIVTAEIMDWLVLGGHLLWAAVKLAADTAWAIAGAIAVPINKVRIDVQHWAVESSASIIDAVKTFLFGGGASPAEGGSGPGSSTWDAVTGGGGSNAIPIQTVTLDVLNWLVTSGKTIYEAVKTFLFGGGGSDNVVTGGPVARAAGGGGGLIPIPSIHLDVQNWVVTSARSILDAIKTFLFGSGGGVGGGYDPANITGGAATGGGGGSNAIPILSITLDVLNWIVTSGKSIYEAVKDFLFGGGTTGYDPTNITGGLAGPAGGAGIPIDSIALNVLQWTKGTAWPSVRDFIVKKAQELWGMTSGLGVPIQEVTLDVLHWAVTSGANIVDAVKTFLFGSGGSTGYNPYNITGGAAGTAASTIPIQEVGLDVLHWVVSSGSSIIDAVKTFLFGGGESGGYNPYNITGGAAGTDTSAIPIGEVALEFAIGAVKAAAGVAADLASKIGGVLAATYIVVKDFVHWTLNTGVPALIQGLESAGTWIGDKLSALPTMDMGTFTNWAMHVGVPTKTAEGGGITIDTAAIQENINTSIDEAFNVEPETLDTAYETGHSHAETLVQRITDGYAAGLYLAITVLGIDTKQGKNKNIILAVSEYVRGYVVVFEDAFLEASINLLQPQNDPVIREISTNLYNHLSGQRAYIEEDIAARLAQVDPYDPTMITGGLAGPGQAVAGQKDKKSFWEGFFEGVLGPAGPLAFDVARFMEPIITNLNHNVDQAALDLAGHARGWAEQLAESLLPATGGGWGGTRGVEVYATGKQNPLYRMLFGEGSMLGDLGDLNAAFAEWMEDFDTRVLAPVFEFIGSVPGRINEALGNILGGGDSATMYNPANITGGLAGQAGGRSLYEILFDYFGIDDLVQLGTDIGNALTPVWEVISDIGKDIADTFTSEHSLLGKLSNLGAPDFSALEGAFNSLKGVVETAVEPFKKIWEYAQNILGLGDEETPGIGEPTPPPQYRDRVPGGTPERQAPGEEFPTPGPPPKADTRAIDPNTIKSVDRLRNAMGLLSNNVTPVNTTFGNFQRALGLTEGPMDDFRDSLGDSGVGGKLQTFATRMRDFATTLPASARTIGTSFNPAMDAMKTKIAEMAPAIKTATDAGGLQFAAMLIRAAQFSATMTQLFVGIATNLTLFGTLAGQGFANTLGPLLDGAVAHAGAVAESMNSIFVSIAAMMTNMGINAGDGFAYGIANGMANAVGAVINGLGQIAGAVAGFSLFPQGHSIGASLASGIAAGIQGSVGAVASAAAALVGAALDAANAAAENKSPSHLFAREVGVPIALGMAAGITQMIPAVEAASQDAIYAALGTANGAITNGAAQAAFGSGPTAPVNVFVEPKVTELEDVKQIIEFFRVLPAHMATI